MRSHAKQQMIFGGAMLLGWLLPLASATAQSMQEWPDWQTAEVALRDGLPMVAAEKLKRIYTTQGDQLSAEDLDLLAPKLLEALVRSDRSIEAIAFLQEDTVETHPLTPFWKGMALARLGDFESACQMLGPFAADPESVFREEAALTLAHAHAAMDQVQMALAALKPQLEAGNLEAQLLAAELELKQSNAEAAWNLVTRAKPVRVRDQVLTSFLKGKIALAQNRLSDAEVAFEQVIERGDRVVPKIRDGAWLGLADTLAATGTRESAIQHLLRFLNQYPTTEAVAEAFRRLEELGAFRADRPWPMVMTWEESSLFEMSVLALYFSALKQAQEGLLEDAIDGLQEIRENYTGHPLVPIASLRLARELIAADQPDEASLILADLEPTLTDPDLRKQIAFLSGLARFRGEDYESAIGQFNRFAEEQRTIPEVYNGAVAALYAQNGEQFDREYQALGFEEGGAAMQSELELERGLLLASRSDPEALSVLKEFLQNHPDDARAPEAQLALAEVYLLEFPPRPVAARKQLEELRQNAELSGRLAEQADYAAVWIEVTAGDNEALIEFGKAFFKKWPESTRKEEVRMKMGEAYYAGKDYPNARTQFQLLVNESPTGPYSEAALFFAGKAASLSMTQKGLEDAIQLWAQVVERGGPLAHEAHRQQAVATLKLDQPDDAVEVLNQVLEGAEDMDPELRLATLMNKGQAFLQKAEDHSIPEQMLIAAIGVYDQVIDTPSARRFWENQAAYFKGYCLEQLEDSDQALEVYYDVVSRAPEQDLRRGEAPEYTWYYRAGFAAVILLQEQEEWKAAVTLAEKLAETAGNRASEASELANRLRLKHFIWEE